MTDSDLRELDGWIADNFLDHARVTICEAEDHAVDWYSGYCATCNSEVPKGVEWVAPAVSSDPSAFALVKREVEQRGWEWACAYERPTEHLKSAYTFTVYVIREPETNAPICYDKLAISEELAGCLAVKAVVEGNE